MVERSYHQMPGELRNAALAELAVHSVTPIHGGGEHELHKPARRISRAYMFAVQKETSERAGGLAKAALTALILAARASGDDVAR